MRICIVIPVLNEDAVLEESVQSIRSSVATVLSHHVVTIVIADNGSNDDTGKIGAELAGLFGDIRYIRIPERGKGLGIRMGWLSEDADIYCFMDVDLAARLDSLPLLIQASADSDGIAYGSRAHIHSTVIRTRFRRILSWLYGFVFRALFNSSIQDPACGYKAVSSRVIRDIVPLVTDSSWFFDTELLVRAEDAGIPVTAIPVHWENRSFPNRVSKVPLFRLSVRYGISLIRLRRSLWRL